jgi:hypothetical protein
MVTTSYKNKKTMIMNSGKHDVVSKNNNVGENKHFIF